MSATPLLLRAGRVVTPQGVIEDGAVLLDGGRIAAVDSARGLIDSDHRPTAATLLTAAILMPGFIDLHVHGHGGLALAGGAEAVREASRLVAATGVTTWYAGLGHGSSFEAILESVEEAASVCSAKTGAPSTGPGQGAKLAGIFMEGPYISVEKRGAWNRENLRAPSIPELQRLINAARGQLRRVNVAPELPGALEFIRAARRTGLVVSIGHSNATYEQAMAAVDAGATIANHAFNAMSGLDHRNPGLAGATMTCDSLLAELILDGVHVHPAAARALLSAKGAAGVALVSDGSQLTGLPDGVYERGGRTLIVKDGACRLADGTLAGSVSTFDQDLRNARAWLTDDLVALTALSAGNAARAMGIERETGAIKQGLAADLVLLDDDFQVVATVVEGDVVYERRGPPL